MSSGELRERIAFDLQAQSDSSYGIVAGDWTEQFIVAARIQPLRGSEPVLAQRLVGVQPFVIKVRSSADTRDITTAFRCRNVRTGAIYNIRAVTPDERKKYIDLLVESGVAI